MSAAGSSREELVDLIRGLALVGICCVNLPEMGWSHEDLAPSVGLANRLADTAVIGLFEGKSFPLFACLLGWGIGRHWERSSLGDFAPRHLRRVLGLGALGLAHAILVYSGDILLPYAVVSLLIWPWLLLPASGRLVLAALAIPLSAVSHFALGHLVQEYAGVYEPSGLAGSYAAATAQRLGDLPAAWVSVLLFNIPLTCGAALAGAAAAQLGWPAAIVGGRMRRALGWLAAVAFVASLAGAAALAWNGYGSPWAPWLLGGLALAAVPHCVGYLLAAEAAYGRGWRPAWLLAAGRNSLTCYVTQGLIAGWVFGRYGLGQFNRLDSLAMLGLALLVALVAAASAALWERLLGRGPLEWLLARVTGRRA